MSYARIPEGMVMREAAEKRCIRCDCPLYDYFAGVPLCDDCEREPKRLIPREPAKDGAR